MSKVNPKISYTLWRLYKDGKRADALQYIVGEDAFANLPLHVKEAMKKGKELHQIAAGTLLAKGTGVFPVPLPKGTHYFVVEEKIEVKYGDFIFAGRVDVQVPKSRILGDFKFSSQTASHFLATHQLDFYNMMLWMRDGKDTMRKGYYCIWKEGAKRAEFGVNLFPKGSAPAFFEENKGIFQQIKDDIETLEILEMLDVEPEVLYDV